MFTIVITGRSEHVVVKNPDPAAVLRGGPKHVRVVDQTPMRVRHLSYRDAVLDARSPSSFLHRLARENPNAKAELFDDAANSTGEKLAEMPLSEWLKAAPTMPIPSEAEQHALQPSAPAEFDPHGPLEHQAPPPLVEGPAPTKDVAPVPVQAQPTATKPAAKAAAAQPAEPAKHE